MSLNTQTFAQFVQQYVNEYADQLDISPNLTPGSPVLALAQCSSALATFLQYQSVQTNNFARLTTCVGPDVDSFCAQFNFPREGAQTASGDITLAIASASQVNLVIPVGTVVQTVGSNIQYQLVADTNQSAYNAALQAYILPASNPTSPVTSIVATAQALVAGSTSDVLANQLVQFGSASYGITAVTNPAPIVNGSNQESDAAYKARFQLYINSLSKGTLAAILETCLSVFPNFTYTILNNTTPTGQYEPGYFTVVANNPGNTVDSGQLASLQAAIELIRAFTIQFQVIAAVPVQPFINLNIAVAPGASTSAAQSAALTAILGYVNNLPAGAILYLSNLVDVVINSDTSITSVEWSSVTVNSQPTNYTPVDQFHVVQATINTVIIGLYSG